MKCDIHQLTNSTAWASASLEGYKNRCMNELKQNNTLQREDNSSSIADTIRRALCKNECSGHGSCIQGNFNFNCPIWCL